jgi:hypothetical protein
VPDWQDGPRLPGVGPAEVPRRRLPSNAKEDTMRTRTPALLSALALGASLLAGCGGGNSTDTYCKELKTAKADFSGLSSSTPDFNKFDQIISTFHKLAKDAPSEVKPDWETLDGALTTLQKDLADAGLSMKDLGPISKGQLPAGMTQQQLQALAPKLQLAFGKLENDKFQKASDKIEKHAKTTCKVDLGTN